MAAVEIRPVRPSEHAAVGALTVAAYAGLGWDLGGYAEVLADVAERSKHAVVVVAAADDGVLGGVTFVPDPSNPYAESLQAGEAGIRMLAVAPAAQGRGVGRALVTDCVERARLQGAGGVALHSTSWMTAAHRLYSSLGFRRHPDRDIITPSGLTLLSFVLDLGSE